MSRAARLARLAKPVVFLVALLPLAFLVFGVAGGTIHGDFVKVIEIRTGTWALRFLALSLLVTPLRRLTGWQWLAGYRRMLGLYAFFYATIHLGIYLGLDIELDLAEAARSVAKRPYITVGFLTWLLLVPLAVTSTKGWIRRLGGRRWNRLHQLVYVAAVTATVHYLWAVKKDTLYPVLYFLLFAALLGWRVRERLRERAARAARAA